MTPPKRTSMRTIRNITIAAGICVLVVLAAGAVAGASRSSNEARELLTSGSWLAVWFALCGLLVAGFVVFGAFRRRVGIAAMHAGCLLVIGGSMWGSPTGHALQHHLGVNKAPRGYAIIGHEIIGDDTPLYDSRLTEWPLDVGAGLSAGGWINPVDVLPFELRLEALHREFHPALVLNVFDSSGDMGPQQWLIDLAHHDPIPLPTTNATLQVLSVTPAIYDDGELAQSASVELALTRGDRHETGRLAPAGGASRAVLSLHPLYDDEQDWLDHSSPVIILFGPGPGGRAYDFHVDLSVHGEDGRVTDGTIAASHPLHYGGYYFYFAGAEGDRVLLMAASDSGWLAVWVGFVCVTGGAAWRCWLVPIYRVARRRAAGRRAS